MIYKSTNVSKFKVYYTLISSFINCEVFNQLLTKNPYLKDVFFNVGK